MEAQAGAENLGQAGGERGQWAECVSVPEPWEPGEQGWVSLSKLSLEGELKGQHLSASSTNFSATAVVLQGADSQPRSISWQCVVLDLHLCEPPEMPLAWA